MRKDINDPIQNMGEPLSRTVGSNGEDCDNNLVNNPYYTLTNEELVELRSKLDLELYRYERELRYFENLNLDKEEYLYEKFEFLPNSNRSLYDIEIDKDYTLYQIEEVDKCLTKRKINWNV